jgi:hypothetical protein
MPDTPEELQTSEEGPFFIMWFETHMSARYELPDMLATQIDSVHRQLDGGLNTIIAVNVSQVCLAIPSRIIRKAGVGGRCFWEAT